MVLVCSNIVCLMFYVVSVCFSMDLMPSNQWINLKHGWGLVWGQNSAYASKSGLFTRNRGQNAGQLYHDID